MKSLLLDIKCEPLDSGNRGQNVDLENKTQNLIKMDILMNVL